MGDVLRHGQTHPHHGQTAQWRPGGPRLLLRVGGVRLEIEQSAEDAERHLPVGDGVVQLQDSPGPEACLEAIRASTRAKKKKKKEVAASAEHVISWMTRLGPLLRFISRRQHTLNLFETNVAGPPVPLFLLGARILDGPALLPPRNAEGEGADALRPLRQNARTGHYS